MYIYTLRYCCMDCTNCDSFLHLGYSYLGIHCSEKSFHQGSSRSRLDTCDICYVDKQVNFYSITKLFVIPFSTFI